MVHHHAGKRKENPHASTELTEAAYTSLTARLHGRLLSSSGAAPLVSWRAVIEGSLLEHLIDKPVLCHSQNEVTRKLSNPLVPRNGFKRKPPG